ncbi:MAG: glycosyltransferase [Candidatus Altiarchaeota archaeon]
MDVGLFHDNLIYRGGAERIILSLSSMFDAELNTSGFMQSLFSDWDTSRVLDIGNTTSRVSGIFGCGRMGFHSVFRVGYLETALRFHLLRGRRSYGVNIFSGFYSIFSALEDGFNMWYCNTPNRTLYDLRDSVYAGLNPLARPLWDAYSKVFYSRDQRVVRECMDVVIANSRNVSERVRRYYGLESEVVYPPVSAGKYVFRGFGDFFLTVNRLIPAKRVDLMVRAFIEMPDKKLVVAGDGPQMSYLRGLARDSPNISFLGNVDDGRLLRLYGDCLATIYLPVQEDFGFIPIEGNAAGKPCISVDEGGCRETVLPGKTGFFIEPTVGALVEQVRSMDERTVSPLRDDCVSWARGFDDSVFKQKISDLIEKYR